MTKWADPVGSVVEHRRELNQRPKLAFIAGAEERSQHTLGRALSDEELRRVIRRYPGALADG